jgi:aldehyde dehydrogenase (NAD+)
VADAVGAARTAFDTTTWSTDTDLRRKCLQQLSAGLQKASGELAQMATLEAGIPSNQGYLIDSVIEEVEWTIALMGTFDWEVDLPPFEMLGLRSNRRVRQEPRGVVGAITPWNAPTSMNVGEAVPALAAGNTVVLKPAPDTPLSAVILAEIIANHTDIPPGVFNVITSNNNEVGGDGLTGDPRVNMFHFTGSTAVGQRIASRAAIGFRKIVLELGGKSANIILDDADLDTAIPYGRVREPPAGAQRAHRGPAGGRPLFPGEARTALREPLTGAPRGRGRPLRQSALGASAGLAP